MRKAVAAQLVEAAGPSSGSHQPPATRCVVASCPLAPGHTHRHVHTRQKGRHRQTERQADMHKLKGRCTPTAAPDVAGDGCVHQAHQLGGQRLAHGAPALAAHPLRQQPQLRTGRKQGAGVQVRRAGGSSLPACNADAACTASRQRCLHRHLHRHRLTPPVPHACTAPVYPHPHCSLVPHACTAALHRTCAGS